MGNEMAISSTKLFMSLLAVAMIVLSGCASKVQSPSGMKVGMHIDAVLEFIVEYPLEWKKDRRLEYGSNEGKVRWSHPDQKGTMLQITSQFRGAQTNEQELYLALIEYPGLTESPRDQVELPAGEAWHISGQTARQKVEIYLFLQPSRIYTITLETAPENFADYQILLDKVIQSFQRIAQ